jgi:hypothetical protein
LFLSLRKTRFFSFGEDNSDLKARKRKTDLFLLLALFFLAEEERALPKLRGLMLKLEVYN